MKIELHPGRDCQVLEIVGNLYESKILRVNETQLILAKIRLPRVNSAADLMEELENDLGHALICYLTVRLTYKHSAFPNDKKARGYDGMIVHLTRLNTEASAVIKRHNPQSAWSPRTSQTMDGPLAVNPLIDLIDAHLSSDQRKEALKKLANERAPISFAKRLGNLASSEETVKPANTGIVTGIATRIELVMAAPSVQTTPTNVAASLEHTNEMVMFAKPIEAYMPRVKQTEEIDPARKIWTEMRRHSRGGRRHARQSISADHYSSIDDSPSPTRTGSGHISMPSSLIGTGGSIGIGSVQQQRTDIMEVALRNKRSVGAETLRSIAPSPSVAQTVGRTKGGTINRLGIGVRSWGWGSSWW
jgi:hypothetical protein